MSGALWHWKMDCQLLPISGYQFPATLWPCSARQSQYVKPSCCQVLSRLVSVPPCQIPDWYLNCFHYGPVRSSSWFYLCRWLAWIPCVYFVSQMSLPRHQTHATALCDYKRRARFLSICIDRDQKDAYEWHTFQHCWIHHCCGRLLT